MTSSIIPAAWQIPDRIVKRLGSRAGRQRVMAHEGHLLLVLHAPPKQEEMERQGRLFWRDAEGQWASKDLGPGIRALGRHIEEYEEVIARLDSLEEQATNSEEYFQVLEELAPIFRPTNHDIGMLLGSCHVIDELNHFAMAGNLSLGRCLITLPDGIALLCA